MNDLLIRHHAVLVQVQAKLVLVVEVADLAREIDKLPQYRCRRLGLGEIGDDGRPLGRRGTSPALHGFVCGFLFRSRLVRRLWRCRFRTGGGLGLGHAGNVPSHEEGEIFRQAMLIDTTLDLLLRCRPGTAE